MRNLVKLLPCAVLSMASADAQASFHLMKVVEVFAGTPASPNAQYVVLQMYANGQNFVNGHKVTVFNATGQMVGEFTFSSGVATGTDQRKILIATNAAVTFFNVTADLTMAAVIDPVGGKVCFDTSQNAQECVSFGSFSGSATVPGASGTPAAAFTGVNTGRALVRRLDIAGGATNLDAADDTNDSTNDFIVAMPELRNNANNVGSIPPNNCPNDMLDGLEQCDDGNANSGDGCSSVCLIEPPLADAIFASNFE